MDIVLELFDTFVFDRLYATLSPADSGDYGRTVVNGATSTFSSQRELPTAVHTSNGFFQPSQYAYMSAWPRDSIWRQALSLYLITW